jgi:hypothetical protein
MLDIHCISAGRNIGMTSCHGAYDMLFTATTMMDTSIYQNKRPGLGLAYQSWVACHCPPRGVSAIVVDGDSGFLKYIPRS